MGSRDGSSDLKWVALRASVGLSTWFGRSWSIRRPSMTSPRNVRMKELVAMVAGFGLL